MTSTSTLKEFVTQVHDSFVRYLIYNIKVIVVSNRQLTVYCFLEPVFTKYNFRFYPLVSQKEPISHYCDILGFLGNVTYTLVAFP
jgi:hypothetical protein